MMMTTRRRSQRLVLGLAVVVASLGAALAPGPGDRPQDPADPARPAPSRLDRARARADAGTRAAELAWVYYSENRIDADHFYRWSHRAWEADHAAATDPAGRRAAADHHRDRMLRLEAKIARIRQLGFGNSLDVAEVAYYVREADFLRAEADEPAAR